MASQELYAIPPPYFRYKMAATIVTPAQPSPVVMLLTIVKISISYGIAHIVPITVDLHTEGIVIIAL